MTDVIKEGLQEMRQKERENRLKSEKRRLDNQERREANRALKARMSKKNRHRMVKQSRRINRK